MKHYGLKGGSGTPLRPAIYFEVKFELRDVRSGYHGEDTRIFEGDWLEDPELQWAEDMVRPLSADAIVEIKPPSRLVLPETVDDKILQYCLKNYRPRIWKNHELGIYSQPQEDRTEFIGRCREALLPDWKNELQKVGDVFLHRFLELEQRFLFLLEGEDLEPDLREETVSSLHIIFSGIREDFSRWVIGNSFETLGENNLRPAQKIRPEFRERIEELKREFILRYNEINRHFEDRAAGLETYEVPICFHQIEVISKGVFWR